MKKEDLEKTIPIDILKDENVTRSSKYKDIMPKTRAEKYKDIEDDIDREVDELNELEDKLDDTIEVKKIEDLDRDSKDSELEEKIKEVAREIEEEKELEEKQLEEDEEIEKIIKEEKEDEKKNVFVKLKDKFMALPQKAKIFIAVLSGIAVALLIVLIVMLAAGGDDNKEDKLTPTEEEPVTVVDNYYYKDGKLYFLNEEEEEIGTYKCDNKSEKKCYVAINVIDDSLDVGKKVDHEEATINERTSIVNEDYVFVYDSKDSKNPTVKLYSINSESASNTYDSVRVYKDNYAVVSKDGKYGLIQVGKEVKELVNYIYDELYMIDGMSNIVAKNATGYVVLDKNGAEVSKYVSGDLDVKYYNDYFIVTKDAKHYGVYNYQGEELVSGYDFATVSDEFMILVKDENAYIRDVNKTKYNEKGYKLKNDSYVKTTHYDVDGKFVKKDISFELLRDGDLVQLLIYDGEEPHYNTLNVTEALANNKYSFMSYFDGKLYFYSDDTKETILGSFECTNKNELTSTEDTLSSCTVASDTLYEKNDMEEYKMMNRKAMIPIIHNRYVFIKDGKVTYLYDLVDKSKNEYTSASSYTPDNGNKLTFSSVDTYVIVLNKKGKYALLKLGKEEVTRVISFKYTAMERVGDYVVAQVSESSYDVYKLGDDTALFNIKGKMMGYSPDKKYIKYMDGSSYVVADFTGTKVSSAKYDYVELYNGYYAGIKDMKLNIYDYSGSKITKEDLEVYESGFSRVSSPSFKVKKENGNYVIEVLKGMSYYKHTYYTDRDTYKEKEEIPETPSVPEEDNTEESGS